MASARAGAARSSRCTRRPIPSSPRATTASASANQRYDLKLEYYEKSGGAVSKLSWSSARQPKQIIPATPAGPGNPGIHDLDSSGKTVPDTNYAIPSGAIFTTTWRYATVTYGPSTASISNASGTWQYRSYVFNATSTSSLIKFESNSTGVACGLAIDNVTVDGP